jgi:glycosyltransferase involved in cell wall biosynthesis
VSARPVINPDATTEDRERRTGVRLLHVFPTFALGGAQVRTLELANTLGAGWMHVVVPIDGRYDAEALLGPQVRRLVRHVDLAPSSGLRLANLRCFRRLFREIRPHLLLTYNWGAIEAALANRIRPVCPHVHFEDGFGPEEAGGRQLRRRVWARRAALSGNSRLIVPSRTLERIALEEWRLSPRRVHYVPNGIDCARFARAAPAPGRALCRDHEIVIGTVCVLRPVKNLGRLLRAFANLPHTPAVRLAIVGDGPDRPALEAQAVALGIEDRVTFAGHVRDPETLYPHFDIFALTSDTEQMPYGLVEAMAARLPVVATDVGDVRPMVPAPSRRFVIPPAQEDRLVAALAELIRSPALRRACGRQNQQHALATFDRQTMLDRYGVIFSEVLAGAGPSEATRRWRSAPLAPFH